MTTHIDEDMFVVSAGQDLSLTSTKYKLVTLSGTIAATSIAAIGILKYGCASGGNASVIIEGLTKAYAGAAVTTAGYPLAGTSSGFLIAATSGQNVVGKYLGTAAAASGDIISVGVDFTTLGYWNGA